MINKVVVVGRLTKDPVLHKTTKGKSMTTFTIACDRNIKTEGQPNADFFNVVVFNQPADFTATYIKKGYLTGVVGKLQSRTYEDTNGKRIYITEILAESVEPLEQKKHHTSTEPYKPDDTAFNPDEMQ